ncbi:MAG: IS66 family transposase zinc-finger binding domain-containing protein [Dehalobacterium sp.]
MDSRDTYIQQLENTIKSLEQQVSNLTEMVLLLRKGKFGSSSEKTPREEISGQLSLFNEAELEANPHVLEPIVKDVNGYKRRNSRTKREVLLKDLPVKEILCEIPEEDQYCGNCGTTLKPIGKETVREELEYIPANAVVSINLSALSPDDAVELEYILLYLKGFSTLIIFLFHHPLTKFPIVQNKFPSPEKDNFSLIYFRIYQRPTHCTFGFSDMG